MDCTSCNKKLPKTGLYCSHCGAKIDKPNYEEPINTDPYKGVIQPKKTSLPTKGESLVFRSNLIETRLKTNKKRVFKVWLWFTVLSVALLTISFSVSLSGFYQFGFLFSALFLSYLPVSFVLLLIRLALRKQVSESEYYTIPGARNFKGHHRCIYCGGKGLYRFLSRRQQRQSHGRCTQCQEILFCGW